MRRGQGALRVTLAFIWRVCAVRLCRASNGWTMAITFYTHPLSRGRMVRWMLEETGQPYATELLDFRSAVKSPAYLAINPMGKVPAIKHGDVVVTETPAIIAYLADAFPDAGLAPPAGSLLRGSYYRWLFFASGPAEQTIVAQACGWTIPQGRDGFVGFSAMPVLLDTIEGAIKDRDYIVGESFTAADLYLSAQLGWGMFIGSIEKRPAFEAYVGRMSQRPATIRAREIDDRLRAEAKH
jgi:glutathione S-transferase